LEGNAVNSDDQREVIAFLSTPEAYRSALPIERIDTHISVVWLVGDRAYKLKRAVHFDYANFSTIELRRAACEGEVRLNRRTAPALYLGVRPVTRESHGRLALGGGGTPVDWVVEMVRFDQQTLFDRLAERHALDAGHMEGLADAIARLHQEATRRLDHGGRAGLAWVLDGNAQSFAEQGATILDPAGCARLTDNARAALEQHADRLEARKRDGFVRECHGDLHLRNICIVGGLPTLFDAVEFNDEISCIDVLYDLAFLLMDLWRRDLREHANRVFNEYLLRTLDLENLSLLPLFLSCRAAVRAKTSVSAAAVQTDARQRLDLETASRQYLALAQRLLRPVPPCLLAIGGLSGAGKTTLARRLAPAVGMAPGALVLRSDLVRKMLLAVAPTTRLGPEGYTTDVTTRVYRSMAERAMVALAAGHSVIADAVFANPADREEIAAAARRAGVRFMGLWLDGPQDVLAERLRQRVGDASDATADVLDRQLRAGVGALNWPRLDGSGHPDNVQQSAISVVRASLPDLEPS
jgi:aminoglycoside phosphotransferase family enzyme/predicted kinase